MATYLYCLLPTASDPPPADLAGIAGEGVRRLDASRVTAWVGTVGDGDLPRTMELARRHDAVVRAALRAGVTPLPARGGQRFADDARCLAELSARSAAIAHALMRVDGCVEMSLHVAVRDTGMGRSTAGAPTRSGAGRGRQYLETLRARQDVEHKLQAELARVRDQVAAVTGGLVREEAPGAIDEREITLRHLVPRPGLGRYRDAVDILRAQLSGRLRMGGPYAPYSFSEIRA